MRQRRGQTRRKYSTAAPSGGGVVVMSQLAGVQDLSASCSQGEFVHRAAEDLLHIRERKQPAVFPMRRRSFRVLPSDDRRRADGESDGQ